VSRRQRECGGTCGTVREADRFSTLCQRVISGMAVSKAVGLPKAAAGVDHLQSTGAPESFANCSNVAWS